jgi:hypothetical protein
MSTWGKILVEQDKVEQKIVEWPSLVELEILEA